MRKFIALKDNVQNGRINFQGIRSGDLRSMKNNQGNILNFIYKDILNNQGTIDFGFMLNLFYKDILFILH